MSRVLDWQLGTVSAIRDETPEVRSFTLALPAWAGHRPGQHVDLRLTAEDGYSVERSYSIASEPERGAELDITVATKMGRREEQASHRDKGRTRDVSVDRSNGTVKIRRGRDGAGGSFHAPR